MLLLFPIDASICASFCYLSCVILTLFYLEFILFEWVLLTLGLMSAKGRSHDQLIRAELLSNGSSVPHSESFSKLSSHQIPRWFDIEGTTTAIGLYANIYFVLTHYAFGGRQCFVRSLRIQHSTSTSGSNRACSAAARVLLASPSRAPPSSCSSPSAFPSYEAFPHAKVRRLRIHVSSGSALPSSGPTSSSLCSSMRAMYVQGGGRMCFPVRDCRCLPGSHSISPRFCPVVPRSRFAPGRPDVFPGRDCV